jgi:hypothetical protein
VIKDHRECIGQGTGPVGLGFCKPDCSAWETVICRTVGDSCGDGYVDSGETCDGGVSSCQDFGFKKGVAVCDTDCAHWNLSTCCEPIVPICGNGKIEGDELCDGDTARCPVTMFTSGTAPCSPDCKSFNTSACKGPSCGDGFVEADEKCDPPGTVTCRSLGDDRNGNATCSPDCRTLDTSECNVSTILCGNGLIDEGEACDESVFANPDTSWAILLSKKRCEELGFAGRTFVECLDDCSGLDMSVCGCSLDDFDKECEGRNCGTGPCGKECGVCWTYYGKTCVDGQCVCDNKCQFAGQTSCADAYNLQTCVLTADGCLVWASETQQCYSPLSTCRNSKCSCPVGYSEIQVCGNNGTQKYSCDSLGDLVPDGTCLGEFGICNAESEGCFGNVLMRCNASGTAWVQYMDCAANACDFRDSPCNLPSYCAQNGFMDADNCPGICSVDPYPRCIKDPMNFVTAACHDYTKSGLSCGENGICQNGNCVERCEAQHNCDDGSCAPLDAVCNDKIECADGSDQKGCSQCRGTAFLCPDGRCMSDWRFCGDWTFKCESGTTVDECRLCDNSNDCPNYDDEAYAVCKF